MLSQLQKDFKKLDNSLFKNLRNEGGHLTIIFKEDFTIDYDMSYKHSFSTETLRVFKGNVKKCEDIILKLRKIISGYPSLRTFKYNLINIKFVPDYNLNNDFSFQEKRAKMDRQGICFVSEKRQVIERFHNFLRETGLSADDVTFVIKEYNKQLMIQELQK